MLEFDGMGMEWGWNWWIRVGTWSIPGPSKAIMGREQLANTDTILPQLNVASGSSPAMGHSPKAVRSRKQRQAGASFQSLSW